MLTSRQTKNTISNSRITLHKYSIHQLLQCNIPISLRNGETKRKSLRTEIKLFFLFIPKTGVCKPLTSNHTCTFIRLYHLKALYNDLHNISVIKPLCFSITAFNSCSFVWLCSCLMLTFKQVCLDFGELCKHWNNALCTV